ncbi:DUF1775 domain-containing protein [Pseudochrobactrum sp. sp1633]|uniref:DUF1775 domain-containing protein n=1 Tax=Pseudochrobactrum sp. sp1633 TaxID=3036706 RepID=UPI0025A50F4C|nr:DUF1775 domain-containing protein [Pseudochrobactrum sp. sp1633]MDM8344220.1 DUF1775 domain-containing protein [Pseudochrobactrum sp. sp1633]HWD14647.1 DUF1775 domain-containing protein [Pseudochrobactrum sp.]
MKTIFTPLCISALILGATGLAQAHVSLETAQAAAGSGYKAVLKIPHGCEGAATTQVSIKIPEGFIAAQPQVKAGWEIETVKSDYQHSYKVHGKDVKNGVTEIIWKGGKLPGDFYDEFAVVGKLASFDKDTTLSFPTVQTCENDKTENWTDIATEGQNPHDLKNPAPQLLVSASAAKAADHSAHAGHANGHDNKAAEAVTLGDLTLSKAHSVATIPNARVAGGYIVITNNGKEDDNLIGGTSDAAGKVEIHEMSMKDNVMKMRKLSEPLAIPAGQTVTLAPSGFHIMFMDLAKPFKEGETVNVELEFEKAGKVNLPFHVNPAKGSADKANDHSQH